MNKLKKISSDTWLAFIMALVLRGMLLLTSIHYIPRIDDFGPLVYPAYLAGYDWTQYYASFDSYYGYGYYWIFAPLFRLISSPKVLIITLAVINTFLMALITVYIYRTLVKYVKLPVCWQTIGISVLPVFFEGDLISGVGKDLVLRTDNEIPLYFVVWLLIGILIRACTYHNEHKKSSLMLSFAAALLLTWGQTVHERSIAITLALAIAMVLLLIIKKKWLLNPGAFFGTFAVGFGVTRLLRKAVIALVWKGTEGLNNLSAVPSDISFIKTFTGIKSCIILLIGNLHSIIVKSYGMVCPALFLVLFWLFGTFYKRVKRQETEESIDGSMIIMLVFGIALCITLAGLSLRWGGMLYEGLVSGEVVYGYKGICYSRYYWVFIGPVIVGLLSWLMTHDRPEKRMIICSWIFFILAEGMFFRFVYPLCLRKGEYNYFKRALNVCFFNPEMIRLNLLVTFGLTILAMAFVTVLRYQAGDDSERRNQWIGICSYMIIGIFTVAHLNLVDTRIINLKFFEGEKLVKELAEMEEETGVKLPDIIYVKMEKRVCKYVLPLYRRDNTLLCEFPDDTDEDYMIIASQGKKDKYHYDEKLGRLSWKVGGSFYIYTNIEEYEEYFKANSFEYVSEEMTAGTDEAYAGEYEDSDLDDEDTVEP